MTTTRRIARNKSKFGIQGLSEARRMRQLVAAISAASLLLSPAAALASIIDASGIQLDTGTVTNIYAQTLLDGNAFNRFNEFKLDAGKIANLYFKQQGSSTEANNLFNLVNSRIDINGTLNAVKNNKIGGSLYFLSKEGMVVGSSGVINAGRLYVATPTADYYKSIYQAVDEASNSYAQNIVNNGIEVIPINASGTISVLGSVNATDGVGMRAAKIGVGKNVSGEEVYGTAAGATVTGASVRTGVTDFSALVNTSGVTGLAGDLTATQTGDGNIVLAAYNDFNDNHTSWQSWSGAGEATAELTVADGATVNAAGDATLSAQAVNNVVVTDYSDVLKANDQGAYTYTPSDNSNGLYGEAVDTTATVNVDGAVAGDHVTITADAQNRYVSANSSAMKSYVSKALSLAGVNLDASYAALHSDATVNISSNASVRARTADTIGTLDSASERALTITANSSVTAGTGASAGFLNLLKMLGVDAVDALPSAGIAYNETTNNATVNVNGTLASAGSTAIKANAASTITSAATVSGSDSLLTAAINYTSASNTSAVTIGSGAQLGTKADAALAGDVDIAATATNSVTTSAKASGSAAADVVTAINITKFNSSANANINASVKSGKSVNIDAQNTVTENSVTADNSIGAVSMTTKLINTVVGSHTAKALKDSITDENGLLSRLKTAFGKSDTAKDSAAAKPADSDATKHWWEQINDLFAAGASIGYASESFKSNITVASGVTISATDALALNAATAIKDTVMTISGSTSNSKESSKDEDGKITEGINNNALVNAAVLYAAMDDSATINIAGADAGSAATLQGKTVTLNADTTFEYSRMKKLLTDVASLVDKMTTAFSSNDSISADYKNQLVAVEAARTKLQTLLDNSAGMTVDEVLASDEYTNFVAATAKLAAMSEDTSVLAHIKNIGGGISSLIGVISDAMDIGSYANFNAGATTDGKDDSALGDKEAKIAIAGSAVITNIANNSRVLIGKNTTIAATGATTIDAKSTISDVAIAGALGTGALTGALNSGGTTAVGGTVGISSLDANSLVVVGEGASISGSAIDVNAASDIDHKNIALATSSGGLKGISLMGVYMDGDANSIVSIDDEARLQATKDEAEYSTDDATTKTKYNGAITIGATNNTNVLAVTGSLGIGQDAGVGAGMAITNFDRYNYAAIEDNDYRGASAERTTLQQAVEDGSGLTEEEKKSLLGSTDEKSAGSIRATNVAVSATTTGSIINTAVAGGVSTGDDNYTPPDELPDEISWSDQIKNNIKKLDDFFATKINNMRGLKTKTHELVTTSSVSGTSTGQQASLSVAAAGSVAVNLLDGDTAAIINGANIELTPDTATGTINGVDVAAKDSSLAVAASGAAALSLKTKMRFENRNSSSVAFAGEVGMNDIDSTVRSEIKNSTINNAAAIKNNAEKSGATVAAGLSMAIASDKGYSSNNGAGAASVSLNNIDSNVYALMTDNAVNSTAAATGRGTTITNTAYDNDTQVTGGLNVSIATGGGKAYAAGATVAYSALKNDVQSVISGGTYQSLGTTDVKALTNITSVGIATGIGVAAGSDKGSTTVEGSLAYNSIANNATASVTGTTMSGTALNVAAYDDATSTNAYNEYLQARGFDADGSGYLADVTTATNEIRGDKDQDGNAITKVSTTRGGNTIVTGAVSVAAATSSSGSGGGAAQAAISISDIDNDYNAGVKNSTITMTGEGSDSATTGMSINAASNTILAGFAVGATGSNGTGPNLGGSVSWNTTDNDVTATLENSTVYTPTTQVLATTGATEVNVAGQLGISTGKGVGIGMALAYNSLNNNTGSYIYGGTLAGINGGATTITVDAANADRVYSVGASVTASAENPAISGVAVANLGRSNIAAIIDEATVEENGKTTKKKSSIKNASRVKVKSSDDSARLAVIGNVAGSSGASVGGSAAINDIGNIASGDQSNTAAIRNTTITTLDSGTVAVNAVDRAALTTIAVGTAISSASGAGTGAGAGTVIKKATNAELSSSTINAEAANTGNVTIGASTNNDITSAGVVIAGSAGSAAAGVGIAVNKISSDTTVIVDNVTANVVSFNAESVSTDTISALGIGGAVAQSAGVAGNLAINLIDNDTTASLKGATINATGNIGVITNSRDTINNYGGAIGVAAMGSSGAGVGISVSYDEISGTTAATVDSSELKALGADDTSTIELAEYTADSTDGTLTAHRGLVVDATAEHTIKGVAVTAGAAVTGGVSVGAAGTVTVNKIKGATNATLTNTTINSGVTELTNETNANVHVNATDRTTSASYVGGLAGGIGGEGGGALGGASDTEVIDRDVTATIKNDTVKTLNANAVDVTALNKASATTQAYGVALAGGATGAAALAGTVSTALTSGQTLAGITNANGTVGSLAVAANHLTDINLVSAAGAVAAAIGSGAAGAGIGIINDDSTTAAELVGSSITGASTQGTGAISVTADNKTTATTKVVGIAASVGAAGINVAVNNLNNKVAARVAGSTIAADGSFTERATNTVDTDFASAAASAGGVALAVGVGVNTIDTGVVAELTDSKVSASSVTVAANEELDIDSNIYGATVGFGGINANASITSIGTTLAGRYSSGNSLGASLDTRSILNTANTAVSSRDKLTASDSAVTSSAFGTYTDSDGKKLTTSSAATATTGTASGEGVQVKIAKSDIVATGDNIIGTNRTVNADIVSAQAAIAAGSGGSASVAVLDVKRKNAITIDGSNISANNIAVMSNQDGTSSIDAYQVAASGGISLSAAYAATTLSGDNTITINNSALQAMKLAADTENTDETPDVGGTLSVVADDSSTGVATVYGATAGAVAGGVLIANATNTSDVTASIKGSNLIAGTDVYETTTTYDNDGNVISKKTEQVGYTNPGDVTVVARKENTLQATVNGGALGVAAAQGLIANAADSGSAKLTINGASGFLGDTVLLATANNPAVQAVANAYTLSLLGSAGASIATASAKGASSLTIGSGSTFSGTDVIIAAGSVSQWVDDGTDDGDTIANVSAQTTGNSIAVKYGAQANVATATSDIRVGVNIGESTYDIGNTLNIMGANTSMVDASAKGLSIGGLFGSGSNVAISKSRVTTDVTVAGAKAGSTLGDVSISGLSYVDADNSTQGYGGGIVTLSPLAAHSENSTITNTTVNLGGNWDGAATMDVAAINNDDIDITADSVNATVVGASGTEIDNSVNHNAELNITGTVTTTGEQLYQANNTVNHDVDLKGSGYGGATVAGTVMKNDLIYTTEVNINKATLSGTDATSSITVLADTAGSMDYDNALKSAGVVAMTTATTTNNITYDNAINVTGSTLTTAKADQDITLAATDETKVDIATAADTQGGYIGAASADSTARLDRGNRISIDRASRLVSTNDVNIYAGASVDGATSELTYSLLADAYNKTLVPVWSAPTVNNTMTQSNQVAIAGDVESVRHVNLKASKGSTSVTTSAREYNLYTGETGSGSVTSTVLGEQAESEKTNNYVTIAATGKVLAGIHNTLNLTINGAPAITINNGSGTIDYSGVITSITGGSDWFSDAAFGGSTVTISNSLYERYTELNKLLEQYSSSSAEYAALYSERSSLLQTMVNSGFATENNGAYFVASSISMPALELSDLVISGGNITIDADNLTGSGRLSAKTAGELSVTNNTGLYLKVNDLAIKDKGGSITYNEVSATGDKLAGFSGKVSSSATSTVEPNITIASNGDKVELAYNGATYTASQADIGIAGSITNAAGDIKIKNSKHDITVAETASINGRNVAIQADNGSVTQISKGITFIGANPIAKYQFTTKIANQIQSYISGLAGSNGSDTRSFADYDKYVSWVTKKSSILGIMQAKSDVGLDSSQIYEVLKQQSKNNNSNNADGSIFAGKNVYISAKNVNLDGVVQSGYQNYKVALDATAQAKITALDKSYAKNRQALTDQEVMTATNDKYCITNNAGAYYNSATEQYEYNVKVYYNPSTGELLTESIAPDGGQVYISGAISSTGNGRILAMNGTPDISIDTSAVKNNLQVNAITNKNLTGYISINDTQQNKRTEYTTDGTNITTTVTKFNPNGSIASTTPTTSEGNKTTTSGSEYILSTSYSLPGNMAITWTGGTTAGQTITKKQYEEKCLLWGAIKWGKTEDFVANTNVKQGQITLSVTKDSTGKALDTGVVIGEKAGLTNNFTIETKNYTSGTKEYSPVVSNTTYDHWWEAAVGYGRITYTWTEKQGSSQSSTYSLKANAPIEVGFLGGSTGDISIKAGGNVSLAGNVVNATAADGSAIGTVTLTSTAGAINSIGSARVDADTLTVSAASGISLNHGSISGQSTIAMNSTSGDVTLVSDKGDITLTGTAGAAAGNLAITADGSITTATSASLNGTRIDLTSKGSSINALVAAGTSAVTGDSRSAAIYAKAYGDITLENTNGDMRLGEIVSTNGDVTLTTSGSFVDALAGASLADSASKVDRWQEMGIVSTDDAADSRTAAETVSRSERVSALETSAAKLASENGKEVAAYKSAAQDYYSDSTMTAARDAYVAAVSEANGDTAKINAAYKTYQAARSAYFSGKGFTSAEQDWIASYADVANSQSYGWSQKDLLYAIQDTIINSKPGQIYTTDTPNVVGKNITLNAGSNTGIDGEQLDIGYSDLSKLENLKVLADSKAGDLTWNDETQVVSVRQQQPITVQLAAGGKLAMNANTGGIVDGGNVYLAGVKNTTLDISGTINTTKDVKLLADKGVTMADGTIIANNLTIMGGSGDIGSADNYIETNLKGNLEANSSGSVYIHQKSIAGEAVNPLNILSIAAGTLYLSADNGMYMTTEAGKTAGYINAQEINLSTKNGSIGKEDDAIRILENGAVVNANAEDGSIYIAGAGTAGTLTLDNIGAAGEIAVSVNGDLNLGFESEEESESGTIAAGGNSVELEAGGSIAQSESAGGIKSDTITVTTGGGQELNSAGNTATSVTITGKDGVINGNIGYTGEGENISINIADGTTASGSVKIENTHEDGTLNIDGAINTSGGNIDIDSASSITLGGDVTTGSGSITIDVNKGGTITGADSSIVAGGQGNVAIGTGSETAGGVAIGEIIAGGNASIDVGQGDLAVGKVDGDTIGIKMGEKGSSVDIDTINTSKPVEVEGDNINANKLETYTAADGTLVYRQKDGTKQLNILTLSGENNADSVRFENLWVGNAAIVVNSDNVTFDGLRVDDVAYFADASGHITSVWGVRPEREADVDVSYWLRPNASMYLAINGSRQYSDGLLLDRGAHYQVYNQRLSAVEHMLQQLNDDRTYGYRRSFIPQAAQYLRYDLHDASALITGLPEYAASVDGDDVSIE